MLFKQKYLMKNNTILKDQFGKVLGVFCDFNFKDSEARIKNLNNRKLDIDILLGL